MADYPKTFHRHDSLPTETWFRVLELQPGSEDDHISVLLHHAHWEESPVYEAISYAWGDPKATTPVIVNGKRLDVTVNLQTVLRHLRYKEKSRILWADAIWFAD